MTKEELVLLRDKTTKGIMLLGEMAILKERIAWLESGEEFYFAFDRGASHPGVMSASRVEIKPSADLVEAFSRSILDSMSAELKAKQQEFEAL